MRVRLLAEAGGDDLRFLRILPVVVRSDKGFTSVVKFEFWIRQWIGHARLRKGGSDRANQNRIVRQCAAADNEADDENIVTGLNVQRAGAGV